MKVIVLGTRKGDITVRDVEIDLDNLQHLVGGYIEPCAPCELSDRGIELLVNEEGLLKGLELNENLWPFFFVGRAVILAYDCDDLTGLTDNQIQFVVEWLNGLTK